MRYKGIGDALENSLEIHVICPDPCLTSKVAKFLGRNRGSESGRKGPGPGIRAVSQRLRCVRDPNRMGPVFSPQTVHTLADADTEGFALRGWALRSRYWVCA